MHTQKELEPLPLTRQLIGSEKASLGRNDFSRIAHQTSREKIFRDGFSQQEYGEGNLSEWHLKISNRQFSLT
ncbi:MAG: hypothetical protein NWR72_00385 [Bacteroidia bacterium]|nr:hypothetical protein [Bacteroidia bacterium]